MVLVYVMWIGHLDVLLSIFERPHSPLNFAIFFLEEVCGSRGWKKRGRPATQLPLESGFLAVHGIQS